MAPDAQLQDEAAKGHNQDEESLTRADLQSILRRASERMKSAASKELDQDSLQLEQFPSAQDIKPLPRLSQASSQKLPRPVLNTVSGIAKVDALRKLEDNERKAGDRVRYVEDPVKLQQQKVSEKKATTGSDWFNLPKTNLTPELKRDLQLLSMRGTLDPKRFYKKESMKSKPPAFSEVGTIIDGPADFYSSRLPNRERKRNLVEEILSNETSNKRFTQKYDEIQAAKTSGRKAHYKKLKEKRSSRTNR